MIIARPRLCKKLRVQATWVMLFS